MREASPVYIIDRSVYPPSCLPSELEGNGHLVDITVHGDAWRRYLNINTGKIHDCAEYHKQYRLLIGEL